ncbi:hypothetical protein [Nocardia sp. AG03]|uniref:hypothetical protein n=1 Tax=Nocardia sp. AG03 TaxID=3025312 RepID=UPI00241816B8|nr:hypothetical protein [Nocardia sp. AG03]
MREEAPGVREEAPGVREEAPGAELVGRLWRRWPMVCERGPNRRSSCAVGQAG